MDELKQYRIIDNHFPSRNLIVFVLSKNDALSIGASRLATCNIRVMELKMDA